MKTLSEKWALLKLRELKTDFQTAIRAGYEHRAKSCLTCEMKGVCCTDAHFVNVHITRLEAAAIRDKLGNLSAEKQREIDKRVSQTIRKYALSAEGDTFAQTFACPLFEKEIGCLIHEGAKPAPCIQHACYENRADLPPDELQTEVEKKIERLNEKTYRQFARWLPLPVWLDSLKETFSK